MKKIITAIGEKKLNEALKKEKFEVLGKDIQYIEGIFEQLEVIPNVDTIIVSNKLFLDNKYNKFIYRINLINKNIKLIFILENKETEIIKYLKNKNIKYYFNNSKNYIKYLISYLKVNNIKLNRNIKGKFLKNKNNNSCKVIIVTGVNGVGKTFFTSIFSKVKKEKLLIIDLDKEQNSLHILYKVNKVKKKSKTKSENKSMIENRIMKTSNNSDLLTGVNVKNDIKNIINKYKRSYDYIIIDLGTFFKSYMIKQLFKNSNKIIFVTEGNMLQIKKSKKLLDFYLKNWNISKEKFSIVLNKKNKNTIHTKIIKNNLYNINILGEIKFDLSYENIINNHLNLILYPQIVKEYKKIIDKI